MIAQVIKILNSEGQRMTEEIRKKTPKVTGKTAKSLDYEVSQTNTTATLQITAKPFFRVVETGRGPTKQGAPKGSPTLVESIKEWLRAKGTAEGALGVAYYIAKKIHEKGTKLKRAGGRKDIFSDVLSERNVNKLERSLLDAIADFTLRDFLNDLEKNKLVK